MPTGPVVDEPYRAFSPRTSQPPVSDPRAERTAATPANAQQPLGHAETVVSFPIPTSPDGADAVPASFTHSIRQSSSDATASTRIDPVSEPPQPSVELQPALAVTRFVEPGIHFANPSNT